MRCDKLDRRRFLKQGTVLAGLTVGGVRAAGAQTDGVFSIPEDILAYGRRSRYVSTVRVSPEHDDNGTYGRHAAGLTPLQDSIGNITPNSLHFVTAHGYPPPDLDPREHRLLIHGLVDRPLIFTMDELIRLPSVSRVHFLECGANRRPKKDETIQLTHGKTACAEWTGVPLSVILREARVQRGAKWIVSEGAEAGKMFKSLSIEKAMEDVLLAYGQNGEPLMPQNGYPLRLFVPGFEALYSVKWLRRIKVVDRPYMGFHDIRHYTKRPGGDYEFDPHAYFEFEPRSVITSPSGGQRLNGHGYHRITGLAWSGGGVIRKVEVSTDNGRSWKQAEIQGPAHKMAHTRFNFIWNWKGEETVILSRCTDEWGQVQPTIEQYARNWGFTAEQLISGESRGPGYQSPAQPWRVRREGTVYNAFS